MQQLQHTQTKSLTKSKIIKIKIMTEAMSKLIKIIALTGLILSNIFGKLVDLYKKIKKVNSIKKLGI